MSTVVSGLRGLHIGRAAVTNPFSRRQHLGSARRRVHETSGCSGMSLIPNYTFPTFCLPPYVSVCVFISIYICNLRATTVTYWRGGDYTMHSVTHNVGCFSRPWRMCLARSIFNEWRLNPKCSPHPVSQGLGLQGFGPASCFKNVNMRYFDDKQKRFPNYIFRRIGILRIDSRTAAKGHFLKDLASEPWLLGHLASRGTDP